MHTRQVIAGNVAIGGGAPVSVQTMTNTDTRDVSATLAQIRRMAEAGADIVRVSVYDEACAEAVRALVDGSPVPLVADIHFDHKLAIRAIENGMYAIGCSQYTPDTYMGKSFASNPFGKVLAEGTTKEELLFVSVDCAQSDYARELIPSLPANVL